MDMPDGAAEVQAYWNRARIQWEKNALTNAPIVVVAKVSLLAANESTQPATVNQMSASLAPYKVLRGSIRSNAVGIIENHWCADFKVSVADKGIYLLAIDGRRILMAAPLIKNQERAGVSAFFARVGEPDLWK